MEGGTRAKFLQDLTIKHDKNMACELFASPFMISVHKPTTLPRQCESTTVTVSKGVSRLCEISVSIKYFM